MKKLLPLLLLSSSAFANVISFDDMGDSSAYIFNDFNASYNDSQRGLLIGGDANLQGYSVATMNNGDDLSLVVGGNLNKTGGDVNGKASVDGTTEIKNTSDLNVSSEGKNFNQGFFTSLSDSLSSQISGTSYNRWGSLVFTGDSDSDTIFFDTTSDSFASIWGIFTENVSEGTRVVFNVSGQDVLLDNKDWLIKDSNYAFNHNPSNILFNFYEAEYLTVSGGFYGSILAPNADVLGQHGHINGQLIANSFTGSTQLNDASFNTDYIASPEIPNIPVTPSHPVNLPATILLTMIGAVAILRRRKTKL